MRRLLFYSAICSMVLFSCKKDHKTPSVSTDTKYKVSFNVSGFSVGTQPFGSANPKTIKTNALKTNALSDGIAYLYYAVYDSNGVFMHNVSQTATQSGFGTINDNLPMGTYTAIFIGYNNNFFTMTGAGFTLSNSYLSTNRATNMENSDTFFKRLTLTVGATANNSNIVLDRIVGALNVNIEDALPAEARTLVISVNKEYDKYNLQSSNLSLNSNNGVVNSSSTIPAGSTGITNYNHTIYLFNTIEPFTITIQCLDRNNVTLASKIIPNVHCEVNKKTILTGKLFGGPSGNSTGGFTVNVDSTWDAPANIPF